jgi:hypothetical protein
MSVSPAALIRESDEQAVAESVLPPGDAAAQSDPGVIAAPRPPLLGRKVPPPPVGAARAVAASPPNRDAGQHHPEHLAFLESARMDREMARELHQSAGSQRSAMSITAALMNMSNQRFVVLAAGVLLLTVGLLALRFPVFLSDFDQWGFQINCGSGLHSSLTQAGIADSGGTHFVDQCHTAIAMRRTWTIPLAGSGALLLGALLVRSPRQRSANA